MDNILEPGLILVDRHLDCILAHFPQPTNSALDTGHDTRGQAFFFENSPNPAIFTEIIRTLPNMIRGNHVHLTCIEELHVIDGSIEVYLMCMHRAHVYKRILKSGESVVIPTDVPHAFLSIDNSECVIFFDRNPRNDRQRVPILTFS